jgi:hypothetical protein
MPTEKRLQAQPGFAATRGPSAEVLDSREQIPTSRAAAIGSTTCGATPTTRAACGGAPRWPSTARPSRPGKRCSTSTPWARPRRRTGSGPAPLPGPDYRRCLVRCRAAAPTPRGARVRHSWTSASSTAASVARGQEQRRLAGHPTRSTWAPTSAPARSPIRATRASSSAGGAASRWPSAVTVFEASARRLCLGQRRPHARLRAHHLRPRHRLLQHRAVPAAGHGAHKLPIWTNPSDAKLAFWREHVLLNCAATGPWAAAPGRAAPAGGRRRRLPARRRRLHSAVHAHRATRSLEATRPRAAAWC